MTVELVSGFQLSLMLDMTNLTKLEPAALAIKHLVVASRASPRMVAILNKQFFKERLIRHEHALADAIHPVQL